MNSYVIPAYNEEDTLESVLKRLSGEIIVVNDASTDKTEKIAKKYATVLTNKKNMGHAYSLLRGLKKAKGEYVFYLDADDQIRMVSLPYGYDMVSGYRIKRQDKLFRKMVSFILRMVILIRHGYYIRDANCPCKMIRREALRYLLNKLPKQCTIPSIDLEILARRYKFSTLEVSVTHYPLLKPRKGFLQSINKKSLNMFWNAFLEIIRL